MRKEFLVIFALMFLVGSAAASFDPDTFLRGSSVESVTGLTAEWDGACAVFTWDSGDAADFSTFVFQTTSNVSKFNGMDENLSSAGRTLCTVGTGKTITATVYRVDSNASGLFLNVEPDASYKFQAGEIGNAAMFLFYSMLATIAGLVGFIVLVIILVLLMSKMGLLKFIQMQ